jgi:hypothetical protein
MSARESYPHALKESFGEFPAYRPSSYTKEQSKDYFFVILSVAKHLSFKPPRCFTARRIVQNDLNIHGYLTAT